MEDWKRVDRDKMQQLVQQYPGTAIASMYGVTSGSVYYRMRTYGIQRGDHVRGPKKSFDPPKEELERAISEMSMSKVAEKYGVSETVVFTRLKQLGVEGPSRSERLKRHVRTPEHNAKIADALTKRTGELASNWRGGISARDKLARSNRQYSAWKISVLTRDGFKCIECGVEQGRICQCCSAKTLLHAHHVAPFSKAPELRYEVSNGVSLCGQCHWKSHHGKPGELLETPESHTATTQPVTANVRA